MSSHGHKANKSFFSEHHWIGLKDDLQENMTFDVKNDGNTIEKPWKTDGKLWKIQENYGKAISCFPAMFPYRSSSIEQHKKKTVFFPVPAKGNEEEGCEAG